MGNNDPKITDIPSSSSSSSSFSSPSSFSSSSFLFSKFLMRFPIFFVSTFSLGQYKHSM